MLTRNRVLSAAALAIGLAACSDSSGPGGTGRLVTFSIATKAATAAPVGAALLAPEVFADSNGDTLVVDQVELVIKQLKLERVEASAPCDSSAESDDHGHDGHDDDCEEVEAGPFLFDLPLGAGAARQFTVALDTGTYKDLAFHIHKPEDDNGDPADIAFLQQHPEFNKLSMRVSGSFNGTPFTFISDDNFQQRSDLVPPLVVSDNTPADVTLFVDLNNWFRDGTGDLLDPNSALKGQPNENTVRGNIRNSFRAFEDGDHDGEDDHDQGGDDS